MRPIHLAVLAVALVALSAGFLLFAEDGPDTFTVKVVPDDGIESVTGAGEYSEGDVAILKADVKGGHFFSGWYDAESNLLSANTVFGVVVGNDTYYAKTTTTLTVEISGDLGVSGTEGAGTYRDADFITVDCTLKSGFEFKGWYNPDGFLLSEDRKADIPTSSFTYGTAEILAKTFSDREVEVVVEYDSGVRCTTGQGTYRLGETITLSAKLFEEYDIEGWYDASGRLLGKETELQTYAEDKTVVIKTVHKPQVFLELDHGTGIAQTHQDPVIRKGVKTVLGADLMPGYSFDGWYTDDGKLFSERQWTETTLEEDTALIAKAVPGYTYYVLAMTGVDAGGKLDFGIDDESYIYFTESSKGNRPGWYTLDGELLETWDFYSPPHNDGLYIVKTILNQYLGDNELRVENYPEWYDGDCYCIILDNHTKKYVTSYRSTDQPDIRVTDGTYDICYYNGCFDKSAVYETETVTIGDSQVRHMNWVVDDRWYSMDLTVDNGDFEHYRDHDGLTHDFLPENLRALCDYRDPFIVQVAEKLSDMSLDMTDLERADFVLKFVQNNTWYQLDEEYNGTLDYPKSAVMTLWEGRGDCEDCSILYSTLMKAMGYDSALLDYSKIVGFNIGHMSSGICLPGVPGGKYYEADGKRYYFCEPTGDYEVVGQFWDGLVDPPKMTII